MKFLPLALLVSWVIILVCYLAHHKYGGYNWSVSASSPEAYPTRILSGSLRYGRGAEVYLSDNGSISDGWGIGSQSYGYRGARKQLPSTLELTWFSLVEDKFYTGQFALPVSKLRALFRAGSAAPGERFDYDTIKLGLAPGGHITIWASVQQNGTKTEVAQFIAQPTTDVRRSGDTWDTENGRAEWINSQIEHHCRHPEAVKQARSSPVPVGRWAMLAKRFPWVPVIHAGLAGRGMWIYGLNGEEEWLDLSGTRKSVDSRPETRAAPAKLDFYWLGTDGEMANAKISLDEDEAMSAFAKMAAIPSPAPLILLIEPVETLCSGPGLPKISIKVSLRQGDEHYQFEHMSVNCYSVSPAFATRLSQ